MDQNYFRRVDYYIYLKVQKIVIINLDTLKGIKKMKQT